MFDTFDILLDDLQAFPHCRSVSRGPQLINQLEDALHIGIDLEHLQA